MALPLLGAVSTEARFQALVTLIGGVLVILGVIGGLVWRASMWMKRQADATRANTEALQGTAHSPGLIATVGHLEQAVGRLTQQLADQQSPPRGPRRRY